MQISEAYGALPWLGNLWGQSPRIVLLFVLFIDFTVMSALMGFEQMRGMPVLARHQFRAFIINDTIIIPPFLGLVSVVMQDHPRPDGWYTSSWWHYLALTAGYIISIGLNIGDVRGGVSTLARELSPSKLWHTIVFGIMGYWMFTGLVAGLANAGLRDRLALIILTAYWIHVVSVDIGHGPRQNSHCEWSWRKLKVVNWPDDPKPLLTS